MVLSDWRKTTSPLAFWYRQVSQTNYEQRWKTLGLDIVTESGEVRTT